jgi:hypothetical protein
MIQYNLSRICSFAVTLSITEHNFSKALVKSVAGGAFLGSCVCTLCKILIQNFSKELTHLQNKRGRKH